MALVEANGMDHDLTARRLDLFVRIVGVHCPRARH